jgi:hypothetical protein
MLKITDHELANLIAEALHASGAPGNAERLTIEPAYGRAAAVMNALRAAGVIACRQERAPEVTMVKSPSELDG